MKHLIETSRAWDLEKAEYVHPAHEVMFDDQMYLHVPDTLFGAVEPMRLDDWALKQACDKVGPPPYGYIVQCPKWLAAENLNTFKDELPLDRTWMIRAFEGRARAILSDRYMPIGITHVLEWVDELTQGSAQKFTVTLEPDRLHLKLMVLPPKPDDPNYGYGVYVREGEVGNLTLGIAGYVQRTSCSNSIIFDDNSALRIVHLTGRQTFQEVRTLFKIHLNVALKTAVEKRDAIAKAEEEKVEDFASVVQELCKRHSFSDELHDQILIGGEGKETVMGVVNGLSFAAHFVENPDDAIRMESLAGAYLMRSNLVSYQEEV